MDLLRYFLFFGIVLLIGYYIKNTLERSNNNNNNIQTPGYLIDNQEDGGEHNMSIDIQNKTLLNDLDRDINNYTKEKSNANSIDFKGIQTGGSNGSDDPCCLPGSPGANEYNYGKNAGAVGRCGPVTTFDPNGLAKSENFRHSTPEVINGRTQNWIPPPLISQLHYVGPFEPVEVQASNQNLVESTCNFVSEKTNLAQYFKANPDLYLATDQYSTYKPFVPFTSSWIEQSDCFNNIKYSTDNSIPGNFVVNKVH